MDGVKMKKYYYSELAEMSLDDMKAYYAFLGIRIMMKEEEE